MDNFKKYYYTIFIKDNNLDITHSQLNSKNEHYPTLNDWLLKYHWYNQEKEKRTSKIKKKDEKKLSFS